MFGSWDGPDIASFWFAVAAFVASGWSVRYTRAAHRREEERERERKRPEVDVRFTKWIKEPIAALFAVENRSGKIVDRVTVRTVVIGDHHVGFAEATDDMAPESSRNLEHTFRQLAPGTPQTVGFVSIDNSSREVDAVKFVLTFHSGSDSWEKLYEVELPPGSPAIFWG